MSEFRKYYPITYIDIYKKMNPTQNRRFKILLKSEIESLFTYPKTKKAAVRFTKVLVSNMNDLGSTAIAISTKPTAKNSIKHLKLRGVSEYVANRVLDYLTEHDYLYFEESIKEQTGVNTKGDVTYRVLQPPIYFSRRIGYLMIDNPTTKLCASCKYDKPLEEFKPKEAICNTCRNLKRRV